MNKFDFLAKVDRKIAVKKQRVAVILGEKGSFTICNGILPGDYLLSDGSCSASVDQGVIGIFVSKDKYIPLSSLTSKEACPISTDNLPSQQELEDIQEKKEIINNSLSAMGAEDVLLPEDVVGSFLCREDIGAKAQQKNRTLAIKKYDSSGQHDFPEVWGGILSGDPNVPQNIDLLLIHQFCKDPLWLLQKITENWYYVLDTRLTSNLLLNNKFYNGRIYESQECLIVENPYAEAGNGEVYTYSVAYAKDAQGLYRKIDAWNGKIPA